MVDNIKAWIEPDGTDDRRVAEDANGFTDARLF